MSKPSKAEFELFKKNANDESKPDSFRAKFKKLVDKFEKDFEEGVEDVEKEVKKVAKKVAPKKKRTTKKAVTKADILKEVGKTEEECEDIIERYKALRKTSQTRKKAETKAKADNKKRVAKLKKDDKVIKGTTTKKASSELETTAKKVTEKIEKEVEKVEKATEKKVKAEVTPKIKKEVAKDKTKTTTQKKAKVKSEVEKKVAEVVKKEVAKEGKKIVAKLEADTKDIITNITTALGKMSKDLQKEYLIKLRSDIDKMLTKYMYGGLTDGANAMQNITQSQMSAESVNLMEFGGEVADLSNSAFESMKEYTLDQLREVSEGEEYVDDLHNRLFNQDYFIIGYAQANDYMKENDLEPFEVIEFVQDYEKDNFGETNTKVNSEAMINMWAYIMGENILYNLDSYQDATNEGGYVTQEQLDAMIEELENSDKFKKGGKLWIDTGKKGGTKGVKKSRKGSFRAEADKRGIRSKELARRVIANPSLYEKKGIDVKSAHMVNNMVTRKRGGFMQGYDARQDESLGMRRGKESMKKQSMKGRRDDSYGKWGKRGMEDRDISMKKGGKADWIDDVVDSPNFRKGAFTKKAKRRGLTPEEFMRKVLANPNRYDERTRRQAQFMKNIGD
mgnify:CR=1 FL=1